MGTGKRTTRCGGRKAKDRMCVSVETDMRLKTIGHGLMALHLHRSGQLLDAALI